MSVRTILHRGVLSALVAAAPLAWAQDPGSAGQSPAGSSSSQTYQGQTSTTTTTTTSTTTTGAVGSMTGRVTEGAGAGVPNASITVTDTATGQQYRALTGADGSFTVGSLPPGTYRVDVETNGFRRISKNDIVLTAGAPVRVELLLGSGDVRESVEVKAVSPVYQNETTGERGMGFGTRTMREMPVIDRNGQELIGLMSGVTPPYPTPFLLVDPQRNRVLNVNGQSYFANNHSLDGLDNNEPFSGILATHVAPVENIQQMNVRTANYNAEYGRAGGAVVNVQTRPGTNDYHGSLYAFNTFDWLQARNPFNTAGDQPQARNTWNQFGADVGGPIVHDKTFFFAGYEGQFQRAETPMFATVPTPELLNGNFSGISGLTLFNPASGNPATGAGRTPFFNNRIPSTQINPVSQALLGSFPAANMPGLENNYLANAPYRNDYNRFNGRLDHHFSQDTMAWLRYNYSRYFSSEESALGPALGTGGEGRLRVQNVAATINHNFTPNILADFRFGYNRYDDRLNAFAQQTALGQQLGFFDPTTGAPSTMGLPSFSIAGYQYGSSAGFPMHGVDNTFNWVSGWSAIIGRHQLKFGADFRRLRVDGFQDLGFGPAGSFGFTPGPTMLAGSMGLDQNAYAASFASFLLGAPSTTSRTFYTVPPGFRQTQGFAWIGDTIQLTSRLSLDLGLRYEVYGGITPRFAGGFGNFNPVNNSLIVAGYGENGENVGGGTDWNNLAPRFGFAYRVHSGTVVRGGYAISYFPVPMSWSASNLFPGAFGVQQGLVGTLGQAGTFGVLPNVTSTSIPSSGIVTPNANQPLTVVPGTLNTPYVQSFNFSIQHDFGSGTLLDAAYVGTLGRQLPYTRELNAALPGAGLTGLPLYASYGRTASTVERGTGINSNYNSLQVNLTKRFSHGLALQASYTYSKSLDYASNAMPFLNNIDIASNYGPSDFDRTHMLRFSHIWELPFGAGTNHLNRGVVGQLVGNWQINGIFTWNTGMPFTVFADPTLCNCPGNMLTPNLMNSVSRLGVFDTAQLSLNAANFGVPAAGSFGNVGRNSLRGPNNYNYNMSLFRSFPIHEQMKLELRGEAYNLFNTPQWGTPVGNLNSSAFGQTLALMPGGTPRQINIGARLLF